MAIIWRIISAFMSFILWFSGLWGYTQAVPVDTAVYSSASDGFLGQIHGASKVFYTYEQWEIFCKTLDDDRKKEYASSIDKSLFDEHNLIIVDIMCPDSNSKVKVTSAMEINTDVELEYIRVSEYDMGGFQAICYDTVFVTTNKKYVSNIKINKNKDMTVPFLVRESMPRLYKIVSTDFKPDCYDENFDMASYLFCNYEDYKNFVDNGQWKMDEYIADEQYFETKNLVVVVFALADGGDSLRISYPVERGNTLEFKCYAVSQPVISTAMECEEAVFVETSKRIDTLEITRGEKVEIPFCLNGKNPMMFQ